MMDKGELVRAAALAAVVLLEWWAMQPYRLPLLAWCWLALARWCQGLAAVFGRAGLAAEHNYYMAAETGM